MINISAGSITFTAMQFKDKQQHAISLFLKSNFLPIQMIYFEKTASLMYDISTNVASSLIQQLFLKTENVHGYGTRSATEGTITSNLPDLKLKKIRFAIRHNSSPKLRHVNKSRFTKESRVSIQNTRKGYVLYKRWPCSTYILNRINPFSPVGFPIDE